MISNFDEIPNLHKKVFCTLYKEYLNQNNNLYIDSSIEITEKYFPNIPSIEMTRICLNLKKNGLLRCNPAENLVCEIRLTNDAIAFMEHRFKNNVMNIINFILSLK